MVTAKHVALIDWIAKYNGRSGPACVDEGAAGWEDFWQQDGVALVDWDCCCAPMALLFDAFAIIGQSAPHCILVSAACRQGTAARTGEAAIVSASTLATSFIRRIISVNPILFLVPGSVCDLNHILGDSSWAAFEDCFS